MVHNLDPFLWEITSGFGIRWYGLAYLAAFVLAYFVFQWLGPRTPRSPRRLSEEEV